MRDSIFISYSHKDADWAQRFDDMLRTQRDEIRVFRDPDIRDGEDWESRLQAEISRARIALILVSNNLTNSDFVTDRELPWILKARSDGLVVNWVQVEPSIPPPDLEQLQAFKVQSSNRCLSQLHGGDQDAEIKEICERLIKLMGQHARPPRWEFFNRVSDVVHRRFAYAVRREIAIGDHSVVYAADAPGKHVVVKAQVRGLLEDSRIEDLDDLVADLEKAKGLRHPAFIRLYDWALDTDPQIIVTELVRARPLRAVLRSRADDPDAEPISAANARFVIQTIAQALEEYHNAGLVYSNIRPSDVLISKPGEGDWFPRISAFRATQLSARRERDADGFRLNQERLTYLAPEQYQRVGTVTQQTDQYSLGLLAVELLQGCAPVRVDHLAQLEAKTEFFLDPAAFGGDWATRSPDLTRIILRMLDPDPDKRWDSMADVAAALGGGGSVESNNRRIAKSSYLRLMDRRDEFMVTFYANLFEERDDLRAKFPGDHDWQRQHKALGAAMRSLLNFSEELGAAEPTILTDTASTHRELGLTTEDYGAFEAALFRTLEEFDEGSEEILWAWRSCIADGMSYMRRRGSAG